MAVEVPIAGRGLFPLCYERDVSDQMVQTYRLSRKPYTRQNIELANAFFKGMMLSHDGGDNSPGLLLEGSVEALTGWTQELERLTILSPSWDRNNQTQDSNQEFCDEYGMAMIIASIGISALRDKFQM